MLRIDHVVGDDADARFAGRRRDIVLVDWTDAVRRRLRSTSAEGLDVAIDLPRGTFLAHGTVLHDDGERILVVERAPTPTLIVRFDPLLDRAALLRAGIKVGHAFGNQHVPIEIAEDHLRIPLTTSRRVAEETIHRLSLCGVTCEFADVPLANIEPLTHDALQVHSHGHAHD